MKIVSWVGSFFLIFHYVENTFDKLIVQKSKKLRNYQF